MAPTCTPFNTWLGLLGPTGLKLTSSFHVQMERVVTYRMALVITVREIATDLQHVLRLLQVIYNFVSTTSKLVKQIRYCRI